MSPEHLTIGDALWRIAELFVCVLVFGFFMGVFTRD